jgi:hypothetical protein
MTRQLDSLATRSMHPYLLALRVRIEYPEIRAGIYPRACAPLPTSIIGRKISVNQLLHEILWTERQSLQYYVKMQDVPVHQLASQSSGPSSNTLQ